MKRILVTGGSGFIGSHIVEHYQGKAEVRVLDNLRTGRRENLNGLECEFLEGDVSDRAAVAEAGQRRGLHLSSCGACQRSRIHGKNR